MYILLCGYKPFYFQDRCGNECCDWQQGGVCDICQVRRGEGREGGREGGV